MSLQTLQTKIVDVSGQLYQVTETLNKVISGRANVTGTFTLGAGVATTIVTDPAFESSMVPIWIPTTSNAAAAMTNVYVSSRDKGTFTLTHANTGSTDRTFLYIRWG